MDPAVTYGKAILYAWRGIHKGASAAHFMTVEYDCRITDIQLIFSSLFTTRVKKKNMLPGND